VAAADVKFLEFVGLVDECRVRGNAYVWIAIRKPPLEEKMFYFQDVLRLPVLFSRCFKITCKDVFKNKAPNRVGIKSPGCLNYLKHLEDVLDHLKHLQDISRHPKDVFKTSFLLRVIS
jgi:hypothetical protein